MDPDPDFARAISKNIRQHWSKEEHCDLKIIIGDYMVSCSQFLLCSCSTFFNVLLHSDSSCINNAGHTTVKVSGIEPDIFAIVLDSIFKGENRINEANMIDLLYAAHHLQIDFLVQKCETFIADHVTVNNYLDLYPHSVILKSELIWDKILGIIAKDFDKFRQTQVFLDLPMQTLSVVERKDIEMYDNVVEALLQWVEHHETVENLLASNDNVINMKTNLDNDGLDGFESDQHMNEEEAGFIKVIFKNEKLISKTEAENRKEMIGTLISHAHLNLVSRQGLKLLLDNDLVMDNGAARNAVRKALSLKLEPKKHCKNTEGTCSLVKTSARQGGTFNDNVRHVLIFLYRKCSPDSKMIAYDPLADTFFNISLSSVFNIKEFQDLIVHNNSIFLQSSLAVYEVSYFKNVCLVVKDDDTIRPSPSKMFILNGNYVYSIDRKTSLIRRTKYDKGALCTWTIVGCYDNLDFKNNSIVLRNFNHHILAFIPTYYNLHIVSFDTKLRVSTLVTRIKPFSEESNFTIFTLNERFFLLTYSGKLTEITLKENGSVHTEEQPRLWEHDLPIFGAVFLENTLYILANLQTRPFEMEYFLKPITCQFGSIKFVHFCSVVDCCQHITLTNDWLTQKL